MTAGRQRPIVTLRPAQADDATRVMEWRNDADAVRFSITRRPVSQAEHLRWFAAQLKSQGVRLWIAEEAGNPVGQVRLDVAGDTGTVSIAVASPHRGRGLGARMLRALIESVAGQEDVRRLMALTHPENVPSLRAFQQAGFRRAGRRADGFLVLELQVPARIGVADTP